MPTLEYVLVTPVKNERAILPALLNNVEAQDPRPQLWLVIDDFSHDGSYEWLQEMAATREWVQVRRANTQSDEYLGTHVAQVKREGLEAALEIAAEHGIASSFIGVLDADLELPPDHYGRLMEDFEHDPKLGVVSSLIASVQNGATRVERFQRQDLPRGPTQFFRVECLRDIGGLPPWPGFDGAANVKARSRGWRTRLNADVIAIQKRATATRFGHAAGYRRKGQYAWFLGVHPLLVLARSVAYGTSESPVAGWSFLRGWTHDLIRRKPRCPDPEVRRFYGHQRLLDVARAITKRGPAYIRSR